MSRFIISSTLDDTGLLFSQSSLYIKHACRKSICNQRDLVSIIVQDSSSLQRQWRHLVQLFSAWPRMSSMLWSSTTQIAVYVLSRRFVPLMTKYVRSRLFCLDMILESKLWLRLLFVTVQIWSVYSQLRFFFFVLFYKLYFNFKL
jgi:hypothetical protein